MEQTTWIEMSPDRPAGMADGWPGEFDTFSSLDPRLGIPQLLCLITTRKEGGKANACLHSGSAFYGDPEAYYVLLTGLMAQGHTCVNILREGEFCLNFLHPRHLDACFATIEHNGPQEDELAAAGLTALPGKVIRAPRVGEAFLCLECKLQQRLESPPVVIGRVVHAAKAAGFGPGEDFTAYQYVSLDPATGGDRHNFVLSMQKERAF